MRSIVKNSKAKSEEQDMKWAITILDTNWIFIGELHLTDNNKYT